MNEELGRILLDTSAEMQLAVAEGFEGLVQKNGVVAAATE